MERTWALLIIDDSQADRKIYRRHLSQGTHQLYTILEASSAEQGLALCQNQQFDAILLDFRLPGMSGLQTLDAIKQHSPHTAVIMLTAYGDEVVAVNAMKGGAQDYLVKEGLEPEVLRRTVRNVVHQAQLKQQLQKQQEQQRLLTLIAFRIRQSLQLEDTLETAVTEVRRLLRCDRVLIYQFAADKSGEIIAESVSEGWTSVLGQTVEDSYFQNQGAEAYRQGRKQVVADVYKAELDPCHLLLLKQFEVQAILVTPILMGGESLKTNQLWGLVVAHQCSNPRQWLPDEVRMFDELSIHVAIAIRHAELLEQTQVALEQQKALNLFKSQIIATVSHEYNAPLAAIQMAAATLQTHQQTLDVNTRERFLNIIEQKSKHMSALVSDMLLVNQADLNQLQLQPVSLPLGEFLARLIAEQQMLGNSQHELKLKVRGDLEGFVGDRGLLRQVFVNLLTNAIKYSPQGGTVWVQLTGEPLHVIFHIRDEGIGIPEKDQKQLFQPFSRGSNVDSINGTGLGLYIAKTAVELHGGTIAMESQKDHGTCFTVQLPKQPQASAVIDEDCSKKKRPQGTL